LQRLPEIMEVVRNESVVYYIPAMIRTLLLITSSYNVRCSFLLVSRSELFSTYAKINGVRAIPRGVTQLCITTLQVEYRIYLKFNPRSVERFSCKIIHSDFHPFFTMLLYLSAYNIFIDRPLTLYNQCLSQVFIMGYNLHNVVGGKAPYTVRCQMFFPIRRPLRYIDSAGNIIFTCTQCYVDAYNFNM
jgi:hypothetical protein